VDRRRRQRRPYQIPHFQSVRLGGHSGVHRQLAGDGLAVKHAIRTEDGSIFGTDRLAISATASTQGAAAIVVATLQTGTSVSIGDFIVA
jgi:hypothetical protein